MLLLPGVFGCVLHGTDSGVCDLKLDPGYVEAGFDTEEYRHYMLPHCHTHVKYAACVPEMEDMNASAPIAERWLPAQRVAPSDEYPQGRFYNHTLRNKDLWVHAATQEIIDERLSVENDAKLEKQERNEYKEGQCEGDDWQRCKKWPICKGSTKEGCFGYPIQPRMTRNQDCQQAFEAYMCFINFPRCYYDDVANEYKSTMLCRSACKNFFKACNYHKSLWRCGKTEYFNGKHPERFDDYRRYTRDFFPGQPFRNAWKKRGYRNIGGRCTPAVADSAMSLAPSLVALLPLVLWWSY